MEPNSAASIDILKSGSSNVSFDLELAGRRRGGGRGGVSAAGRLRRAQQAADHDHHGPAGRPAGPLQPVPLAVGPIPHRIVAPQGLLRPVQRHHGPQVLPRPLPRASRPLTGAWLVEDDQLLFRLRV